MNPYSDFHSDAFDRFLVWLSTSDLRMLLYPLDDVHPLFRFVHVAAAATLLGSILVMDLRLMGVGRSINAQALARLILPWAIGSGIVAVVSGLMLFLFDPIATGVHTYFIPKMGLLLLGLVNALAFHRFTSLSAVDAETRPGRARAAGAISIALWIGVFLMASLNASERVPTVYAAEAR
jgi:hypothetical protein